MNENEGIVLEIGSIIFLVQNLLVKSSNVVVVDALMGGSLATLRSQKKAELHT